MVGNLSIEKVDIQFPNGKAIIVGKQIGGSRVQIDGIVLHTAFTLSERVSLIEKCKIDYSDKVIYICGHGNATKGTIGGRSIEEIAKMLRDGGYTNQLVYLTSCDADKMGYRPFNEQMGNTQYSIRSYLNKLLSEGIQDVVFSDSDGSTITIKNSTDEPEIYVIKGITEKWAYVYQLIHFQAIKSTGVILNVNLDLYQLEKMCTLHYARLNKFKEDMAVHAGMIKPKLRHRISSFADKVKEAIGIYQIG